MMRLRQLWRWLQARFDRAPDAVSPSDLNATHAATVESRRARRAFGQERRYIELQLRALDKELEILRDKRGRR